MPVDGTQHLNQIKGLHIHGYKNNIKYMQYMYTYTNTYTLWPYNFGIWIPNHLHWVLSFNIWSNPGRSPFFFCQGKDTQEPFFQKAWRSIYPSFSILWMLMFCALNICRNIQMILHVGHQHLRVIPSPGVSDIFDVSECPSCPHPPPPQPRIHHQKWHKNPRDSKNAFEDSVP